MYYGKKINGALHISATQKEGYKPVETSRPEGFDYYTFVGYEETEEKILINYEAVVNVEDNTLQRITDLESRMDLTEGAVQEMLVGEVTNESEVLSETN